MTSVLWVQNNCETIVYSWSGCIVFFFFFFLLCKSRNYLLKICEPWRRIIFHFMVTKSAHRDRSTLTFPFSDSAERKMKEKTYSVLMWLHSSHIQITCASFCSSVSWHSCSNSKPLRLIFDPLKLALFEALSRKNRPVIESVRKGSLLAP